MFCEYLAAHWLLVCSSSLRHWQLSSKVINSHPYMTPVYLMTISTFWIVARARFSNRGIRTPRIHYYIIARSDLAIVDLETLFNHGTGVISTSSFLGFSQVWLHNVRSRIAISEFTSILFARIATAKSLHEFMKIANGGHASNRPIILLNSPRVAKYFLWGCYELLQLWEGL